MTPQQTKGLNEQFDDLHTRFRHGEISNADYTKRVNDLFIAHGKLPPNWQKDAASDDDQQREPAR